MKKIIGIFLFVSVNIYAMDELHYNARRGDIDEVIAQCKKDKTIILRLEEETGDSFLHIAAQTANIKLAQYLAGKGLESVKNKENHLPSYYDFAGVLEHISKTSPILIEKAQEQKSELSHTKIKFEDLSHDVLFLIVRNLRQQSLVSFYMVSRTLMQKINEFAWPVLSDYGSGQNAFIVLFPTTLSNLLVDHEEDERLMGKNDDILYGEFIAPNEKNPIDMLSALDGQVADSRESYIAVGSERGFISAALTKAKILILIDYSSGVVDFNRINIGLLAISKDIEDYRHLRLYAQAGEWQKRAALFLKNQAAQLPSQYVRYLLNERNWYLWDKNVRKSESFSKGLHKKDSEEFTHANYLFDESLFAHIKKLVNDGQIISERLDLNAVESVNSFFKQLQQKKVQINIFDISNAWWVEFMTEKGLNGLLNALVAARNTSFEGSGVVCLATDNDLIIRNGWRYACLEIPPEGFDPREHSRSHFYKILPLY
jgi:hypothetical protein